VLPVKLGYDSGGGQGKSIFIDTEGNFRPERIEKIAERFGLDPDRALDNVVVARAYSHDLQTLGLWPFRVEDSSQRG
jgi:RecA/RadA recombinase